MSRPERDRSFDDLWHWLEHPEAYPDHVVSIPIDILPEVLTPNRARLLAHLQRHGPADSVEGLAVALGRNYSSVSRDVGYLLGTFLEGEQHGHKKRLWAAERTVVITGPSEAPVRGKERNAPVRG